jgi:hypothetical protein
VEGGYAAFNPEKKFEPLPEDKVWDEFSVCLERLVQLADMPAAKYIVENPRNAALIFGYSALTLLRSFLGKGASGADAALLADHWQLVRKLSECWERVGINSAEALRTGALARAVLARSRPQDKSLYQKASDPGTLAAALILENYDADDFRMALGINRFEDVTWFNKESFEETLFWVSLFLLADSSGGEQAARISAISARLRKAEEGSGFRLDELLGALTGNTEKEKKIAKVVRKKPAGKK